MFYMVFYRVPFPRVPHGTKAAKDQLQQVAPVLPLARGLLVERQVAAVDLEQRALGAADVAAPAEGRARVEALNEEGEEDQDDLEGDGEGDGEGSGQRVGEDCRVPSPRPEATGRKDAVGKGSGGGGQLYDR